MWVVWETERKKEKESSLELLLCVSISYGLFVVGLTCPYLLGGFHLT